MLYHYEAEHAGAASSALSSGMPSNSGIPHFAAPAPMPANPAPSRESVEQLAQRTNPQHDVTCPSCGEDVPGRDLLNHYDRNHAWEPGCEPLVVARGPAGGFIWPLALSPFGLMIAMTRNGVEPGSFLAYGATAAGVLSAAVLVVALWIMVLGKASLKAADDHLVLSHPVWPARPLRLPLRSHLVSELQDTDDYRTSTIGLYLVLHFANGTLRVGCLEETLSTFQARWCSNVGKGRGGARAHIRLGREDFYALQLWLHQKGQLTPKEPPGSRQR